MAQKQAVRVLVSWVVVLVLGAPIGAGISIGLVRLVHSSVWEKMPSWLWHMYDRLGVHGEPFLFSWPWMTWYIVVFGLPYGVVVLGMEGVLRNKKMLDGSPGGALAAIGTSLGALVLAVSSCLIVFRFVLPIVCLVLDWLRWVEQPASDITAWMVQQFVVIGVPFGAICLAVQLLLWKWCRVTRE
jgi:hypothetical protein